MFALVSLKYHKIEFKNKSIEVYNFVFFLGHSKPSEITTEMEENPVVFTNALHLAVEWGANDVLRFLLREQVDPNKEGRLPDAYDVCMIDINEPYYVFFKNHLIKYAFLINKHTFLLYFFLFWIYFYFDSELNI